MEKKLTQIVLISNYRVKLPKSGVSDLEKWFRKFSSRSVRVVPISIFVRTLEIGTLSVGPFDDSEFLNPLFSTLPSNCP